MLRGNHTIQRSCKECGKIFIPPILVSKYYCPALFPGEHTRKDKSQKKEERNVRLWLNAYLQVKAT